MPPLPSGCLKGAERQQARGRSGFWRCGTRVSWYLANENHGRPFILASHSQGSGHAVRLLQQDILGTPLQHQLIAAYVIGAYVPSEFTTLGLPICDRADETGCIVSWNTTQVGRRGAERLLTIRIIGGAEPGD